jgi:hypothetical protein
VCSVLRLNPAEDLPTRAGCPSAVVGAGSGRLVDGLHCSRLGPGNEDTPDPWSALFPNLRIQSYGGLGASVWPGMMIQIFI